MSRCAISACFQQHPVAEPRVKTAVSCLISSFINTNVSADVGMRPVIEFKRLCQVREGITGAG